MGAMETRRSRKTWILCLVLVTILAALLVKCCADHASLSLRVAAADEQIEVFGEMRTKAIQGEATQAVDYLEYTVNYYPSGIKQIQGSRLDRSVERARQDTIQQIIANLRMKTGKEFGGDPMVWITALKAG